MHTLGQLKCFFLDLGDVTEIEVKLCQGGSGPGKDTEDIQRLGVLPPSVAFCLRCLIFGSSLGEHTKS